MEPGGLAGLRDSPDISKMDDTGMYVWSGILTVAFLAVSWGAAIFWQRWRATKREEGFATRAISPKTHK